MSFTLGVLVRLPAPTVTLVLAATSGMPRLALLARRQMVRVLMRTRPLRRFLKVVSVLSSMWWVIMHLGVTLTRFLISCSRG